MLDRSGEGASLKDQLVTLIKADIETGKYKEGDLLPREKDYIEQYGVSRITVRGALSELEREGLIKRIKGKGTLLCRNKVTEPLLKIEGFTEEMRQKGIIPTTKEARINITKADKKCSEVLGVEEGTPVYILTRIRCINDRPVGLFTTYMRYELDLSLEDACYQGSLYDYLEKEHGITVQKIKQSLTADIADSKMAKVVSCLEGEPILLLKRIGYSKEKEGPVEYTLAKYVASRYEYEFELER